jgi:YidC/Oxa1 family membrane protein insertase
MSLDPLYRVIGWLLAVFYVPTHSLGLADIILTVVIMLVQFPLTAKQARSMIQMQRVQPEIKKIQQKYKDDKAKQNEELLKFYQENKINPLAGCLPMIITIPIGIAVFRTFSKGVQHHLPKTAALGKLYADICGGATATIKACDTHLSALNKVHKTPQAMHFLGMSLNLTAHGAMSSGIVAAIPYYVLIGLVALTGWYQVRQTQSRQLQSGNQPPNAQMQAMTKVFPLFFAFICLGLNAGATLYFVVSNIWRIGQQHLVLGKLYSQDVVAGGAAKKDDATPADPTDDSPPANGAKGASAKGNGKAKPTTGGAGAKGLGSKPPNGKTQNGRAQNGKAQNGDGKGQGMSSGARRKKRKR